MILKYGSEVLKIKVLTDVTLVDWQIVTDVWERSASFFWVYRSPEEGSNIAHRNICNYLPVDTS